MVLNNRHFKIQYVWPLFEYLKKIDQVPEKIKTFQFTLFLSRLILDGCVSDYFSS